MTRSSLTFLPVSLDTAPMEARLVRELPQGSGWQFEPKWDGFRCLAFRSGAAVELKAKSGKPLSRYFPEIVTMLQGLAVEQFVLDGELAIPIGATLSFDALQMRLHPAASRVNRLAEETPALLILFDCLATERRRNLLAAPLLERRAALESFYESLSGPLALRVSPYTRERSVAQRWLQHSGGVIDGVVAKRIDGPYVPGERAMLKVKRLRTADCVVGGFRYATAGRYVGSLLLGLYNKDGQLDHVGFTSSIANVDRPALTEKLEALIEPPGFTGKSPGAPSRWSTERSTAWEPLRPKFVVEVCYDHITADRFRHGATLLRWRPDKSPRQCTFDQLQTAVRPAKLITTLLR